MPVLRGRSETRQTLPGARPNRRAQPVRGNPFGGEVRCPALGSAARAVGQPAAIDGWPSPWRKPRYRTRLTGRLAGAPLIRRGTRPPVDVARRSCHGSARRGLSGDPRGRARSSSARKVCGAGHALQSRQAAPRLVGVVEATLLIRSSWRGSSIGPVRLSKGHRARMRSRSFAERDPSPHRQRAHAEHERPGQSPRCRLEAAEGSPEGADPVRARGWGRRA